MRIAIVGAGLIGTRRARVAKAAGDAIVAVADLDEKRAEALAIEHGARHHADWRDAVTARDVDAVVVSTPNKFLAPIAIAALGERKHVLAEKPMGRNLEEAMRMADAASTARRVLRIGFNHRFHPAIHEAHGIVERGEIGPLHFIRATYGHGGRPGYDKEWRASADLAGGGELLDQGVHVLDLCHWFLGEFTRVNASAATYFWDLGRWPAEPSDASAGGEGRLEDNAFAILTAVNGQTALLHTSWTQWKNLFLFEAFGRDGFVRVEGLGGSYGVERLTHARRRPESGPPEERVTEFPGLDRSWEAEWAEFKRDIMKEREGNFRESVAVMRLVEALYASAHSGQSVVLSP